MMPGTNEDLQRVEKLKAGYPLATEKSDMKPVVLEEKDLFRLPLQHE